MSTELRTPPAPHASGVLDFDGGGSDKEGPSEVVVMDDDPVTKAYIIDALQTIGLKPRPVESEEEAVALATEGRARHFILDACMGEADRAQEGLAALARIKKHDPHSFVAIYSSHPRLLAQASRLAADITRPKSGDHQLDIVNIVGRLAPPHLRGMVERMWQLVGHTSDTQQPEQGWRQPPEATEPDLNKLRYRELKADAAWLKSHLGRHVAFVDGELWDEDADRGRLLTRVRREHRGRPVLVTQVKEHEEVVRIFSPLRCQQL